MLLAVDIGNSQTVLATFDGDRRVGSWRVTTAPRATSDELRMLWRGLLRDTEVTGVAACSTVPALLPALRALGRAIGERVEELSYLELQRMDDTREGHALRRYWKGQYFRSLPDEAIDAFLLRGTPDGHGERLPYASLQAYGGAIADVPDADSAFSQRDAMFEFVAAARWSDAAEDEQRISAARRYAASLEPFASGMYVNAMSDEGATGVARAYPPAKLARLRALKAAYDPDNVFHLNQNIQPA